ncbi:hypothetical protein ACHAXH_000134, partial [Discostella pseudostelligera]
MTIIDRTTTATSLKMSINESLPPPSPSIERQYNLYRGHPNINLLPHFEMKTIMSALVNDDSWHESLNYDRRTCDDDRGDIINMEAAAAATTNDGFNRELFITNGVSHGLELICTTCTQPGDEVWVERPTYFLAPQIFKSNGLIVKALPMMSDRIDGHGDIGCIDIDRLIYNVEEAGQRPPKMMYIIPSYHNPTGRTMTLEERKRLAMFAPRHGVTLVADEVYHLLDWETKSKEHHLNSTVLNIQRPCGMVHFNALMQNATQNPTINSAGKIGCCVSVSSFTKIWAPGVRLGWIDAPSFIIKRLKEYGYINSQGGVAPFMGTMMRHAIESNLLDYLDQLRVEYAERCELMCDILKDDPRISIPSLNSPVKRQ